MTEMQKEGQGSGEVGGVCIAMKGEVQVREIGRDVSSCECHKKKA
jgi:hypothetical protein